MRHRMPGTPAPTLASDDVDGPPEPVPPSHARIRGQPGLVRMQPTLGSSLMSGIGPSIAAESSFKSIAKRKRVRAAGGVRLWWRRAAPQVTAPCQAAHRERVTAAPRCLCDEVPVALACAAVVLRPASAPSSPWRTRGTPTLSRSG